MRVCPTFVLNSRALLFVSRSQVVSSLLFCVIRAGNQQVSQGGRQQGSHPATQGSDSVPKRFSDPSPKGSDPVRRNQWKVIPPKVQDAWQSTQGSVALNYSPLHLSNQFCLKLVSYTENLLCSIVRLIIKSGFKTQNTPPMNFNNHMEGWLYKRNIYSIPFSSCVWSRCATQACPWPSPA